MAEARIALPQGLPSSVETAATFLTRLGHPADPAVAMAANLLDESLTHPLRQRIRRHRSLTMTPQEREGFASSLQARRVLLEGALLSLDGREVREGAVLSAHALCEAAQASRPISLRLGGTPAQAGQIKAARERLLTEIESIDELVEAAVEGKKDDEQESLQQGSGGAKPNARVVHLQNRLNMLGHRVASDGKFGPVTEEAVKDFQAKAGMEPTGVVDKDTTLALRHGRHVVEVGPAAVVAPHEVDPLPQVGDGDPNKETEGKVAATSEAEKAKAASGKAEPVRLGHGVGEKRSPEVRRLQVHLGAAGHPVPQDGRFGPKTHAEVKKFQRKHGLEPSGEADDRTVRALRDAARSNLRETPDLELQEDWADWDKIREGGKVYATRHHTTGEPGRVLKDRSLTVKQKSDGVLVAEDDLTGEQHSYNRPAAADALSSKSPGQREYDTERKLDMRRDVEESLALQEAHPIGSRVRLKHAHRGYKAGAYGRIEGVEGSTHHIRMGDGKMIVQQGHHLMESAQTAALSVTHAPIGKGGTNWITKSKPGNTGQLPAYIQNVRNAIMRDGKSESEAHAIAIGRVEDWAEGRGGVSAEVKAAAAKAVAELHAMGAASKARTAAKHLTEADSKADYPETLACPTCGARAARAAKACPRGHKMTDAKVLMHALMRALEFDRDLELLLRECPELKENWEDWDEHRHNWGKLVKAGPLPWAMHKDSPGRGPTGKMRNFDSMSGPKLAATLEALAVHGEDPEAHQAAMYSAGKKLGYKIQPPREAPPSLLDESLQECSVCGARAPRDARVCQRGHRLEEAIGHIEKGAFHRWLGKPENEPITEEDIARGLAAGGHPAKMANFARNFGAGKK